LGQGFAPRIGSLRPGNENPKAYRPAIMKLPMVTIGAHHLIDAVCRNAGIESATICTPEQLWVTYDDT